MIITKEVKIEETVLTILLSSRLAVSSQMYFIWELWMTMFLVTRVEVQNPGGLLHLVFYLLHCV